MRIPFIGPSYNLEAITFDAQRSVNLYPIISESGTSKNVAALRKTAGLRLYATAEGGPIRGAISSTSGRAFVVSAQNFAEVNNDGSTTIHGTLNTQSIRVAIAESPTEIMVVDGTDGWIFTKATNAWAQITDADFPVSSYVTYQDGYFICIEDETQKFFISGLLDGFSWDALDFTTVESSPDNLAAVISNNGNLWCFGNRSIEVYYSSGAAAFPFERIGGAIIQTGCDAPFTIQKFMNSLAWLGTDEQGQGVVWLADGYQAKRISTSAIERRIAEVSNFSTAWAFVYHEQGHLFYCLQIPSLETTFCFDAQTQLWHERSYRNPETNADELHRASCMFFYNRKIYVGDRVNGKIYEMSLDFYDDAGDEMVWMRVSPHLAEEKKRLTFGSFELDMETGRGLVTGQGQDPQVFLQYSDDGGRTWSSELWRSAGKLGEYNQRVIWRQLGTARDRVWKVGGSDPVFTQLNDAFINAT
jgi:hypothetical protein